MLGMVGVQVGWERAGFWQNEGRRPPSRVEWLAVPCQIALGISTLLYFVPTPLAATHQGNLGALGTAGTPTLTPRGNGVLLSAGSLTLLTLATWFLYELRRVPR
jgi:heme A synthase